MQSSVAEVTPDIDKRVGIIGAGIAGLVTAKVLQAKGFDVLIFEKEVTLGGVWAASRTYPGLKANNSKETYCFSDHSHADTVKHHPTADDVRELLESYADRFNIRTKIRFACEVSQLAESDDSTRPGFQFSVKDIKSGTSETLHFPFVVICNGAFSKISIPEIEGMENYSGVIRHSSHCMPEDLDKASSVLTVGAGKSALDCASSAALKDKKSTLVFRQAHWMAPRYFPGGGRSDLRMVSRFAELFVEYPHRTKLEQFLHGPGLPLVKLWWHLQNTIIPKAAKMSPIMIPDRKMPAGFESIGQVDHIYDLVNEGRVSPLRSSIKKFTETGVELENGEQLEADLVVFGTGWQRDLSFIDESLRQEVFKDGRFRLYRRILPPEQQRLAFVGYFPTLACPISSEIAAHWTAECFSGDLQLPDVGAMDKEIEILEDWARERLPESPDGVFTGPYQCHYINDLMGDMNLSINRTSNFFSEYLATFEPKRYQNLAQEIDEAKRGSGAAKRGFYLSGLHALAAIVIVALFWVF